MVGSIELSVLADDTVYGWFGQLGYASGLAFLLVCLACRKSIITVMGRCKTEGGEGGGG